MEHIKRMIKPGKEYTISVNGHAAITKAREYIGNHCYTQIKINNTFAAQIEIVIDEQGTYNGMPNKWVDFSFIPSKLVLSVLQWLSDNGFGGFTAIIFEDENTNENPSPEHYMFKIECIQKEENKEPIQLDKNKLVLFENGYMADRVEVFWSFKHNAFCLVLGDTDEDGNRIRLYSTTIIDRPQKTKKPFVPTSKNCPIQIFPEFTTEKAYAIPDSTNGKTRHVKYYYKYIAKSVCYVDKDGKIFAPIWATRGY